MTIGATKWQPQTVLRLIRTFPTSAATLLVETDAGNGYLKALGNTTSPHLLACEWVGTHLARLFGLPTLDAALVQISVDDELPFHDDYKGLSAQPGTAFITREERGGVWGGAPDELAVITNPQDITRLVVFDTWTLNCDRHHPDAKARQPHYDNVFLCAAEEANKLTLKAIDHTHCFTCGRDLTARLNAIDNIQDRRIYGLFPGFRPYFNIGDLLQTLDDLRSIKQAAVEPIIRALPRDWEVTEAARTALTDFIMRRARFVADNLAGIIEDSTV